MTELEPFEWCWPLFESYKPQYTAADVVRLTEVADHTIQNWSNRGLLKFVSTKRGKGGVRLYNKDNLLAIKFAQSMIDLGMETTISLYLGVRMSGELILRTAEIVKADKRRRTTLEFTYRSSAIIAKTGNDRLDYRIDLIGPGIPKQEMLASSNQSCIIVKTGELISQIQLKIMPVEAWRAEWAAITGTSSRSRSQKAVRSG